VLVERRAKEWRKNEGHRVFFEVSVIDYLQY